jgi:hypothetical protein
MNKVYQSDYFKVCYPNPAESSFFMTLADLILSMINVVIVNSYGQIISKFGNAQYLGDSNPLLKIPNANLKSVMYFPRLNFDAIQNMTSVSRNLRIIANYILTNLNGLGSITYVREKLEIFNNYDLINLNGSQNLISISRN